MWVLDTSGSLELVGHSVSLLSLLLSILILSSFRYSTSMSRDTAPLMLALYYGSYKYRALTLFPSSLLLSILILSSFSDITPLILALHH